MQGCGTRSGAHGNGGAGAGLRWQTPGQRTDGAATGEAIEQGCPEFREQYARTREAQPDLKSKWAPLVTIFQILAKHRPGAMMAMGSLPVTPRPATTRLLAVCLATGNKPVAKGGHETLPPFGGKPIPGITGFSQQQDRLKTEAISNDLPWACTTALSW